MILNAEWLSYYYKRNYNNTKKEVIMKNDEAYFDSPVRFCPLGEMTGP